MKSVEKEKKRFPPKRFANFKSSVISRGMKKRRKLCVRHSIHTSTARAWGVNRSMLPSKIKRLNHLIAASSSSHVLNANCLNTGGIPNAFPHERFFLVEVAGVNYLNFLFVYLESRREETLDMIVT